MGIHYVTDTLPSARIACLMQIAEQVMAHYRVYVLNDHDKIAEATDIQALDDTHAFEIAKRVRDAQPLEIWQGTRLVGRYGRHIIRPDEQPVVHSIIRYADGP